MVDPLVVQLGVFTTAQLLSLGWPRAEIARTVRAGTLVSIRRGWYACEGASQAARAVGSGGCVSCFSALALRGVWTPARQHASHVRYPRHASRCACRPYGPAPAVHAAVDDLQTAFRCALRCGTAEDIVVVADSMLHLGLATIEELRTWMHGAPARILALLDRVDPASESGTETMVRLRLVALQIAVRTQVQIGAMRVDLLVGERLVIECDSTAHHTGTESYQRDRARDRELTRLGCIVLRLTYEQIHDEWPAIEAAILDLVRSRAHRLPRRRSH